MKISRCAMREDNRQIDLIELLSAASKFLGSSFDQIIVNSKAKWIYIVYLSCVKTRNIFTFIKSRQLSHPSLFIRAQYCSKKCLFPHLLDQKS